MLETLSERLLGTGDGSFRGTGQEAGRPSRDPRERGASAASRSRQGSSSGSARPIEERVDALLAIRESHERHGHIQEVIVQNFRAKPDMLMADHPEPGVDDMLLAIALARLVMGPEVGVQAPPNLTPDEYGALPGGGALGLGRRLASDSRPRQPRGAVAAPRRAARSTTESRGFALHGAARRLSRLLRRPRCAGEVARPRAPWQGARRDRRARATGDPTRRGSRASTNRPPAGAYSRPCGPALRRRMARPGTRDPDAPLWRALDKAADGIELDEDEIALLFTARAPRPSDCSRWPTS